MTDFESNYYDLGKALDITPDGESPTNEQLERLKRHAGGVAFSDFPNEFWHYDWSFESGWRRDATATGLTSGDSEDSKE